MKNLKMLVVLIALMAMLTSCADNVHSDISNTIPQSNTASTSETVVTTSATTEIRKVGNIIVDGSGVDFEFAQKRICNNYIQKSSYKDFFQNSTKTTFIIPALEQYFVPQGMDYWDELGWFMISGYFKPTDFSSVSVILAIDAKTGKYAGEYKLYDPDGSKHTGHDGGVAITEKDLYLSTGYKLHRIPLSDIKQLGNKGDLRIVEQISVPVAASFCNYSNGVVWVGEFYKEGSYDLKGNHIYTNNDGKTYSAWSVGYKVDMNSDRGIEAVPSYVLSIPDIVQGFAVADDGRIFMTQSYGRQNNSAYLICDDPLTKAPDKTVTVSGKQVPMWFLDNKNGMKKISAIPMAEGCCSVGKEIYVIFESGAYYYRAYDPNSVARDPTDLIWKYTLP